jgi:hypothetical protein
METLNALELLFYHRNRRAVLTVARFSGLSIHTVNARLCWG